MKRNSLKFAVLSFLVVCVSFSLSSRVWGSFIYNGHTYKIVTAGKSWIDAKNYAQSLSLYNHKGHLAIIESPTENDFLYNKLIHAGISTRAADGGGAIYAWLGGSDSPDSGIAGASEGNFFWIDGRQFWQGGHNGYPVGGSFTNWGHGSYGHEPDNYNGYQNFVGMGLTNWPSGVVGYGAASQWNDLHGTDRLASVVEFDVPEPASMLFLLAGAVFLAKKPTRSKYKI